MKIFNQFIHFMIIAAAVCFFGCSSKQTIAADTNICEMSAHFINVGQADSTLLEFPCGAVLIDAGAQDQQYEDNLITCLNKFFEKRPDLNKTLESIIITHNHIDHTAALKRICENFTVKRYIDNGNIEGFGTANARWIRQIAESNNIIVREITNDQVTAGGNKKGLTNKFIDPINCSQCDPKIAVLWARLSENPGWSKADFNNKNNQSIVIRVDFGKASFLFTGDAEERCTNTMLDYYSPGFLEILTLQPAILDIDVYHVGHHGSFNGTTPQLLKAMTPEIAVVSVGNWDYGKGTRNHFTTYYYGHPRKVIFDILSDAIDKKRSQPIVTKVALASRDFVDYDLKKKIYTTAADGTIRIKAKSDGTFTVTRNND